MFVISDCFVYNVLSILQCTADLRIQGSKLGWTGGSESTENPVGPPIRTVVRVVYQKNVGFFVAFAMAVNAANNVSYSN